MSDSAGAAASAPSAPSAGASSTNSQPAAPTGGRPQAGQPGAAVTPRPRNTSGQFAPKEGSLAAAANEVEGGQPEQPVAEKEPYRFKRPIKVFGKEEQVDLSEDDIARELQVKRALERKYGDAETRAQKAERLFELAQNDPDEFYRLIGKDPAAIKRQSLAEEARREAMSEHERELEDLRKYKEQVEQEKVQRAEQEKQAKRQEHQQAINQRNQQRFMEALQNSDLPKSHTGLAYLAEVGLEWIDEGYTDFTPQELAKAASIRMNEATERYLGELDGTELAKKLGPKRVQAIVKAQVDAFMAKQGFDNSPKPVMVPDEPETKERIDEHEANRRFKALLRGR